MKRIFCVVIVSCLMLTVSAAPSNNYNLLIAPGTLSETSVVLLWDKQYAKEAVVYELLLNGKLQGTTTKTNYTITELKPGASYTVSLRLKQAKQSTLFQLKFKTAAKGRVYNILDFGAKSDSTFINTKQIQKAIDACTAGGTVYIPKGNFVSGALFLKSNMTLHIAEGATLQGSIDTTDYLPLIKNRFEGWEMETYASLINAGTLNRDGSYNVQHLRITGGGTIKGGGKKLELACKAARGIRSRGRLVLLMNCRDVSIDNLTFPLAQVSDLCPGVTHLTTTYSSKISDVKVQVERLAPVKAMHIQVLCFINELFVCMISSCAWKICYSTEIPGSALARPRV